MALKTPQTIQEKRALKFAVDLLTIHGYGYTITVPSRELAAELTSKGNPISFITVISYWKALERLGYVKREMQARINGVTYYLNRYGFTQLLNQQ